MGKQEDLKHGLHNEEVFKHLLTNKDFTDWIITTAFYSALHLVDYKLFPKKIIEKTTKITISDMDSYALSALNRYGSDKHICRLKMVQKELRPISVAFNWLFTNCNTARYRNYIFPNPGITCQLAEEYLNEIKDFVTKQS
jgi:hypothetical protein